MSALSQAQIAKYAYDAGFRGEALVQAVAIAMAESTGDPGQASQNSDSRHTVDYGLWQINSYWNADLLKTGDWRDPAANARMAFAAYESRKKYDSSGWGDWNTFDDTAKNPNGNGSYRQYLGTARAAVVKQGLSSKHDIAKVHEKLTGHPPTPEELARTNAAATGTTLRPGARGEGVKTLQSYLVSRGYLDPKGVDGIYGADTKAAVQALQRKNGLNPDGIVGPDTLAKTGTVTKPAGATKPTYQWGSHEPQMVSAKAPAKASATPGVVGRAHIGGEPLVPWVHPAADGVKNVPIGAKVFKTLKTWEDAGGHPISFTSGGDGYRTAAIQGAAHKAKGGNATYAPAAAGTSYHERGLAVDVNFDGWAPAERDKFVQYMKSQGYAWGGDFHKYDPVHFGLQESERSRTEVVKNPLGTKKPTPSTMPSNDPYGITGLLTSTTPVSSKKPAPTTLSTGSRGADVKKLQSFLVSRGYLDPKGVDGVYGPKTRAAVASMQAKNGLKPDGVVGPKTTAKIASVTPKPAAKPAPKPVPKPTPKPTSSAPKAAPLPPPKPPAKPTKASPSYAVKGGTGRVQ